MSHIPHFPVKFYALNLIVATKLVKLGLFAKWSMKISVSLFLVYQQSIS